MVFKRMAAAEVNGSSAPAKEEEEPMDVTTTHTENYQTLLDAGLPQKVAESLDNIFQTGLVAYVDLDERAIDALREFNEEGALTVLQQFRESDLSHVQNKSAFLCGVMKTYRQREKQGSKVQESTKGPDEAKIKALLERTGYTLDVTTGQRKYGGPPPEDVFKGTQPGIGTEVFVGKIPRDLYEDELVPLFESAGPIWDLRLMMDPLSGQNRGYAFITYCNKDDAQKAVKLCDNHEIRPGKYLGVCISVANNRLFVGSIPKNKTRESILEDFGKVTEGLQEVILYHQPDDKKKNRGFCFLEYEDHKSAAQARRRLMSGKVKVWGNPVTVEWADPVAEPDPEVMAKVKVLFVRKLATAVTEELLEKTFSQFGKLERVKKLKDYAFVHFEERDAAVKAMDEMNGKELGGEEIEIVLAKPPDKKRKERQAARQTTRNAGYDDYYYYPPPRMPPPGRGPVERHQHEGGVATPKEVHPSVVRGVAEEGGEPLSSRRGAAVLAGPGAIVGAMSAERGRQTCLTSLTPSAARPTTNRTGDPSPSPSSPCSKGPTIPSPDTILYKAQARPTTGMHIPQSGLLALEKRRRKQLMDILFQSPVEQTHPTERITTVKQIEKRDSVLTSKQQIDRLLRPGASYFNLNPFEVLQIDPEATDDELKKRFRALSILVHPDKNQDDPDRAQKAFEAVDKAYKLLLDPEQKKRALDVIHAGKEYIEHMVKEKRKQLKKEGKSVDVEEDDPEVFKQAVYKQTMKLFAELEIKRKEREAKEMHERKRAREEEIEAAEKAKREREWQKNFEETRDGRVDSWRNFQAKGKSKEKKNRSFLKPPKVKMEQRE
ncbi:hypothetical protein INR49_027481 [Caranx melampygus]|nr:hypothetical protein INR49_027481 [Caranx melampygus]